MCVNYHQIFITFTVIQRFERTKKSLSEFETSVSIDDYGWVKFELFFLCSTAVLLTANEARILPHNKNHHT